MLLISSFISSYSFSTLFNKTNLSWLIYESIKGLEIKTSILLTFLLTILFYRVSFSFY